MVQQLIRQADVSVTRHPKWVTHIPTLVITDSAGKPQVFQGFDDTIVGLQQLDGMMSSFHRDMKAFLNATNYELVKKGSARPVAATPIGQPQPYPSAHPTAQQSTIRPQGGSVNGANGTNGSNQRAQPQRRPREGNIQFKPAAPGMISSLLGDTAMGDDDEEGPPPRRQDSSFDCDEGPDESVAPAPASVSSKHPNIPKVNQSWFIPPKGTM